MQFQSVQQPKDCITGLQQVGIGVKNAQEAFSWYNRMFGLNVPVFDDVAKAKLMLPHTNGVVRERRAILAVSMAGGGGAEIWQSNDPLPIAAPQPPKLGDLGIFAVKFKSPDVVAFAAKHQLTVEKTPEGKNTCWLFDPYGNQIQVVEDNSWFKPSNALTGGIIGVVIGVSDLAASLPLYQQVLGLGEVVYDKTDSFTDVNQLPNGGKKMRRVLLRKPQHTKGAFSRLYGNIEVELVQVFDYEPKKIFDGRYWGDLGYIHVCFDVVDMEALKNQCKEGGYVFTVDSANSFDMGDAAGRFSYLADPDGTLIEFVETHRVPIIKKLGWYINLLSRKEQKPLPNWMVATIGWNKVKP